LRIARKYPPSLTAVQDISGPHGQPELFLGDLIAPSRTLTITGQRAKSDCLDSHKLDMRSAKNLLQPAHIPTEEEQAERQVLRIREQVVVNRRRYGGVTLRNLTH